MASLLRELTQEGSEKIAVFTLLGIVLVLLVARFVIPIFRWIIGFFGVDIATVNLGAFFSLLVILSVPLLLYLFILGSAGVERPGARLIIAGLVIVLALMIAYYAPHWYPDAFQASVIDLQTSMQSLLPMG